ncbi:MAG TPA: 3-dehydroquinate synthase [Firmicutes bacterium]|nr:3-dehydroquinate synthase [Bacillota bacterium]
MLELKRNIYLTGFSGSGKSAVGEILASRLKAEFIDLDVIVSERAGKPLLTLFEEDGEQAFRMLEQQLLMEISDSVKSGNPGKVVALGGGALIDPANQKMVAESGILIWLRARWANLFCRLTDCSDRPLLHQADKLYDFIAFNRPFYEGRVPGYAHCDLVLDVDYLEPTDVATAITRMMDCQWFLTVQLGERTHTVLCDSGLLARIGQVLFQLGLLPRGLVWLITTHRLDDEKLPLTRIVREDLESTKQEVRVLRIPDGEQAKTTEEVTRIHDALLGAGTSRDDLIIALGGGTVSDVAGFAAATYMRGIDIVQIPTTLVGMVDAAMGGKTAINHPKGKNLIGAFHQPKAILIDPVLLNTSADEVFLAGLSELVKYGCIADKTIIEECEANWTDILNRPTWEERWTREDWLELSGNPWSLIPLIRKGLAIKARLVSADEREITGERMLLNFGHTFGHAFERASDYAISHGQAIALGMKASFRLGFMKGTVTSDDIARIDRLLDALAPNDLIAGLKIDSILSAIKFDKKKSREGLKVIIPIGIGSVEIAEDVGEEELSIAVEKLKSQM